MVGFYKNIKKYKKLWGSNKNIRKTSNNDKTNNNTY